MTILDIVREYLEVHRYDGLVSKDNGCGCPIAGLSPGDCICEDCAPAFVGRCDGSCDDGHCGSHYYLIKPGTLTEREEGK